MLFRLVYNLTRKELKEIYNGEEINTFINDQVADKFVRCLEDSGVYKQNKLGNKFFDKFTSGLINELNK